MSDLPMPARRRIFLMRHGDVTDFDDSAAHSPRKTCASIAQS
jgi:hypothetical protein